MTMLKDYGECCKLPCPCRVEGKAPLKPNTYTDGSVHHPKIPCLQIGGVGLYWNGRKQEEAPLTEGEDEFMHKEQTSYGLRLWNAFKEGRRSSTRCEIVAALAAMMPTCAVHIASDSKAMVDGLNRILKHLRMKKETRLFTDDGRMVLWGTESPLHSAQGNAVEAILATRERWRFVGTDVYVREGKRVAGCSC